jgi:hypothetical protein
VATALALAMLLAPSGSRASCPAVVAGSCWVLDGIRVNGIGSASGSGRSVTCTLRCDVSGGATLILGDDGTYSWPLPEGAGVVTCASGAAVEPFVEEGSVRQKRGRLILEPTDLTRHDALLDACAGRDVTIRRYRTTVRIASDGTTLVGTSKIRSVTHAQGVPITTRVIERFSATRAPTSPAIESALPRARPAPTCSADLEPRCVTD